MVGKIVLEKRSWMNSENAHCEKPTSDTHKKEKFICLKTFLVVWLFLIALRDSIQLKSNDSLSRGDLSYSNGSLEIKLAFT